MEFAKYAVCARYIAEALTVSFFKHHSNKVLRIYVH